MGVMALKTLEGVFVAKMFVSDEVAANMKTWVRIR